MEFINTDTILIICENTKHSFSIGITTEMVISEVCKEKQT